MNLPRSSPGHRPLLVALAIALLMKALVPTGWMPAFEDGALRIAPCGNWAPQPAVIEHDVAAGHHGGAGHHEGTGHHDDAGHNAADGGDDGAGHHGDGMASDQPCAFAGASLAWTLFAAPDRAAPPPAPTTHIVAHRPVETPGRGLAAPPPPSTGPPLTA